jgi:hypothetical protein
LIEREGPTAVIVTTTEIRLHPENETRLLSIPVSDTPDQTKAVLRSIARADRRDQVDFRPWHALQELLANSDRDVVIPYAHELAEEIRPLAVRLRRDFATCLNLIRAHALLHQATRDRTPDGAIIATIDDYTVVRDLISDLISEGVDSTVSTAVRETVDTVADLIANGQDTVSQAEIGRALKLDKSAVSRRVRQAITAGYLRNTEEGKPGRKAKLVLGDPLPDELELLPDPSQLTDRCSVDVDSEEDTTPPPQNRRVDPSRSHELALIAALEDLQAESWRIPMHRLGANGSPWRPSPVELQSRPLCRYPSHRSSDWQAPDGRTVCGICHPPGPAR